MPNSASVLVVSVAATQPSAWGPTAMPTSRKARIRRQAQAAQADHDDQGRRQQQQHVFQYAVFQCGIPRPRPAAACLSKA